MKKMFVYLLVISAVFSVSAEITYDFTDKAGVFDGTNTVTVLLNDSGTDFIMTVVGTGGDLNSNAEDFGVGNAFIDGTSELITISFENQTIDFSSIDLGAVGGDISDGARLTIGTQPTIDLYTDVPGFNGTSDIYTPAGSVRVNAGETIVLTGSSLTSLFDLEQMTFAVVPEPATFAMFGIGGLISWIVRRSSRK